MTSWAIIWLSFITLAVGILFMAVGDRKAGGILGIIGCSGIIIGIGFLRYDQFIQPSPMMEWAQANTPTIVEALNKSGTLEAKLNDRIKQLRRILSDVDRIPEDDSDYQNWKQMLSDVQQERVQIEQQLEEIYILQAKYQLSPDADLKMQLDTIHRRGIDDARRNLDKYNRHLEVIKKE